MYDVQNWQAEHENLHPLRESGCSCLCAKCYNPKWQEQVAEPNRKKVVRICLCPECKATGCSGWH